MPIDVHPDRTETSSSMFRQCSMTIYMHDIAFPVIKIPTLIPFFNIEKNTSGQTVQMYQVITLECVRSVSDEMLGKMVRQLLTKVDEEKKKIENV